MQNLHSCLRDKNYLADFTLACLYVRMYVVKCLLSDIIKSIYISWIVIRRNWGGKGRDHFPNTMHLKSINTVFLIVKHYLIYLKTHLKSVPCNIVKLKYVFKVHKKCNSVLHDISGIFFPPRNEKKTR